MIHSFVSYFLGRLRMGVFGSTARRAGFVPAMLLWMLPGVTPAAEYFVDQSIGDDANPGTEAEPWRTIFRATEAGALAPGDTLTVKAGTYRDEEIALATAGEGAAIMLRFLEDGEPGNPITVRANPGDEVIIRCGMQFGCVRLSSHNVFEGFIVEEFLGAGIKTPEQCNDKLFCFDYDGFEEGVIIQNNTIRNGGNVATTNNAAIELSACLNCEVRNNVLSNVFAAPELGVPSGTGVHAFGMGGGVIENNEIFDMHEGIGFKRSPADEGGAIRYNAPLVRRNYIHNLTGAAINYFVSVGSGGNPSHLDIQVIENICYDVSTCVAINTPRTSSAPGTDLTNPGPFEPSHPVTITNNTLIGRLGAISLNGATEVEITNNILGVLGDPALPGNPNLVYIQTTRRTDGTGNVAEIILSDYNLFARSDATLPPFAQGMVILNNNLIGSTVNFANLAAWQAADSSIETLGVDFPDANSIENDPMFTGVVFTDASTAQDFRLAIGSPAIGTGDGGVDIGAYPDTASGVVGPGNLPERIEDLRLALPSL